MAVGEGGVQKLAGVQEALDPAGRQAGVGGCLAGRLPGVLGQRGPRARPQGDPGGQRRGRGPCRVLDADDDVCLAGREGDCLGVSGQGDVRHRDAEPGGQGVQAGSDAGGERDFTGHRHRARAAGGGRGGFLAVRAGDPEPGRGGGQPVEDGGPLPGRPGVRHRGRGRGRGSASVGRQGGLLPVPAQDVGYQQPLAVPGRAGPGG